MAASLFAILCAVASVVRLAIELVYGCNLFGNGTKRKTVLEVLSSGVERMQRKLSIRFRVAPTNINAYLQFPSPCRPIPVR